MKIEKTKAVITGGASGLGKACVEFIVKNGGKATILDLQDDLGQALAKELGKSAIYVRTDVSDENSVQTAIDKTVETFGGLNVAINCAGIGGPQKILGKDGPMPISFFKQRIDINLVGTMHVLIRSAEQMAKNEPNEDGERGVIINTSSGAAFQGQVGQAAYSATKAGILGLCMPVAREIGRQGIRIMAIAPGVFATPMMSRVNDKIREKLEATVPFPKRMGRPEEFAALAGHIIENVYLNGGYIQIDGGLRMT